MKKVLSSVLALILAFSCVTFVCATDEKVTDNTLETNVICDFYSYEDAVVITYDGKYTTVNKQPPQIFINLGGTKSYIIHNEKIIMQLFEHDGNRYPQIFIDVSSYVEDTGELVAGFSIKEGAFRDADGKLSKEVKISYSQINVLKGVKGFGIECKSVGFKKTDKKNSKINYYYIIKETPIDAFAHIDNSTPYYDAWAAAATYTCTIDGENTDIQSGQFIPTETGEYVLELRLNNIFSDTKRFNVVSKAEAYFYTTGTALGWTLLSPFLFLLGIFCLFIPGWGTFVIGPGFMYTSLGTFPKFIEALFKGAELLFNDQLNI